MDPGLSFDSRVLTVRTHTFNMRLQWGDNPRAEHYIPGRGWQECYPDFCVLPKPEDTEEWNPFAIRLPELDDGFLELERFRDTIRPDVVDIAQPFCSHQWPLLKLLHNFPRTLDWACVNPVMAYCLANNSEFRGVAASISAMQAVWYSHRKQKVILEWLGFPGTRAVVRLLRKIVPGHASPSRLRQLRGVLRGSPELLDMLAHQKRITFGMLELVANANTRELLTPKLLQALVEEEGNRETVGVADQLVRVVSDLRCLDPDRRLPKLQSIEQATRFCRRARHEVRVEKERARRRQEARIVELQIRQRERQAREQERQERQNQRRAQRREAGQQARRRRRAEMLAAVFPPPPIPGSAEIRPILTCAALQQEGKQQDNCVGGYWPSVVAGEVYVYSVHAPQRATLSIRQGYARHWYISELEISNNRKANRKTVEAVKAWLQRSQAKSPQLFKP